MGRYWEMEPGPLSLSDSAVGVQSAYGGSALPGGASARPTAGWRALLVAREHGEDAADEVAQLRHVRAQELFGRLHRHFAVVGDQPGREVDVGFRRVHLRRVAEAQDAAQMLLADRRADLPD